MAKIMDIKVNYLILILSVIFLLVSINFFIEGISEIGIRPFNNITADQIKAEEEFLLHVKRPTNVFLLHNAKIGTGEVKFKLTKKGDNAEVVETYNLNNNSFLNKIIELSKGTYQCTINKNVSDFRETFVLYFDKRFINQEYIRNDSNTKHFN